MEIERRDRLLHQRAIGPASRQVHIAEGRVGRYLVEVGVHVRRALLAACPVWPPEADHCARHGSLHWTDEDFIKGGGYGRNGQVVAHRFAPLPRLK